MSALQMLVGQVIVKIEEVHDYIQAVFPDGATLSIFNNYYYEGDSVHVFEGKRVASVEESGNKIAIFFDNDNSLTIGMNDDDYNGPEAMLLTRKGMPSVVWS